MAENEDPYAAANRVQAFLDTYGMFRGGRSIASFGTPRQHLFLRDLRAVMEAATKNLNPCGHAFQHGCGGCDPGAIDAVFDEAARTWRAFDPALDLATPASSSPVPPHPTEGAS